MNLTDEFAKSFLMAILLGLLIVFVYQPGYPTAIMFVSVMVLLGFFEFVHFKSEQEIEKLRKELLELKNKVDAITFGKTFR